MEYHGSFKILFHSYLFTYTYFFKNVNCTHKLYEFAHVHIPHTFIPFSFEISKGKNVFQTIRFILVNYWCCFHWKEQNINFLESH